MAVVNAIHEDGRTARMSAARFAAVAGNGWRLHDPASVAPDPKGAPVHKVLDEVGDDPVKAAAALDLERDGKNRPTLISKLEAIVAAGTTTEA